eukprot:GGOE01045448.1.p1 GENE.GGOE01045448.1~~GGOE01045448.1.p1  ORF type:complete len:202 (-),score=65.96 GGOE01045448.1:265-870(-)
MSLYEVLGVAPDCSQEDIRKAYHQLSLRYHPDKNPDNVRDAEEHFKKVTAAFDVLNDPQQRLQFDRTLTASPATDRTPSSPPGGAAQRRTANSRSETPTGSCSNSSRGCPWSGPKDALRVHLRNCIYFDEPVLLLRKEFREEVAHLQARLSQAAKLQRRMYARDGGSRTLSCCLAGFFLGFGCGVAAMLLIFSAYGKISLA